MSTTVSRTQEERRVLAGTLVGTTIEWYDFFIFAQLTATLLTPLFLEPLGESNPALAQILSFAMIGISFFFRPLGAVVAGHLGDRYGRKKILVLTLILMGVATSLIGVLPTYAAIGIGAPILLVLLRVIQGFSAGGEWGGAALMAVEHAPNARRGYFGAFPQIGVPIGMILATGLLFILRVSMTPEQFQSWGWRIPFLLSVVLILVGYMIRRAVEESPVFKAMAQRKASEHTPLRELMSTNLKQVLQAALIFVSNNAAGYLVIAFFISYTTKVLGMELAPILLATTIGSVGWLIFTLVGGWLSDRIGRRNTFVIGYGIVFVWMIPMFMLVDTANIVLYTIGIFVLTIGLGLSYGPQSAMYAEMFPARIRYSGISIGYALGSILGGAFAATVAQILLTATGWSGSIAVYIMVLTVISAGAVLWVGETQGRNLHLEEVEGEEAPASTLG
ncbi:MFS transporter [Arthrobacter sp. MYb211]|uniref:MFS transporter n=1 Tax=Micrococcaceae TaxID=1268 RepID=UPI000CFD4DD6|nr:MULTISPECIES: MFS transporter [unclassified Arthrobacter]PQZ95723.1 MFS transporter [Arthrobacter sp. MYb224]PQZ97519.1 MFS transporter [Arthrobacter sp. MYb229]PRA08253.1 MFS transporter [Arthrobacter sp. MYb221]PRB46565.1 MFS transporter [Arthrobacter sp. MYb216]PRC02867.1 MFS transporter [Arthrobacter sp. MYb211]